VETDGSLGPQEVVMTLVPLGGEVPRVHPVVLLAVVAPPAAAVGGRLQQVVGVLHGVEALVLGQGHRRQRGDGAAMQHLVVVVVRGVQEADDQRLTFVLLSNSV
jgi:hypothetical protein